MEITMAWPTSQIFHQKYLRNVKKLKNHPYEKFPPCYLNFLQNIEVQKSREEKSKAIRQFSQLNERKKFYLMAQNSLFFPDSICKHSSRFRDAGGMRLPPAVGFPFPIHLRSPWKEEENSFFISLIKKCCFKIWSPGSQKVV